MEELYDKYKALLFTLAYQLTGSAADAEDVVQDVFFKACDVDPERLREPKAYLCKMVTNRCLDLQKSARRRREVYVGPWLPEPIPTPEADTLETVVRRDLLSYGMLVLPRYRRTAWQARDKLPHVDEPSEKQDGHIRGRNGCGRRDRIGMGEPLPHLPRAR
ncbi:RNA polymerase sigma factor, sigma-70 family [Paenibacillus barengoltzii]|nr:sigma factor [Paenibacillus barengoltzii]SMF00752.1 RNA polymerase sigma factor, sigma-70 family [Paenibacillus barengoltzii]